ncbi:hypothetical protein [Demequina lutea]|uniref:Uncharacterized protein n=1 Tax=Demequina lutea TaxID=431489 RepID=A0A7Y9ZBA5_9MICO|nr:hypothetical protein [Demequina lutea]NYI42232.1 hypothetical protein [Demequina lutea]
MTEVLAQRLKSARGWLVGVVVGAGAIAWLSIAWASGRSLEYSGHLGVVGVALTLGSAEAAYLVWRNWALEQRGPAYGAAGGAGIGSLLILGSTLGAVEGERIVAMAMGVGLLGVATAVGLLGVYRATGKSTPATATAMVTVLALAYFASVLWAAVP